MFHRSERLLLRPVWTEDWQAIYGGIADEGVVRNLARAPWPYSKQDARDFVSRPFDPLFPKFLITLASDAQVIGCIGLDPTEERANAAELGYWIARSHWGQGIATEAGRGVCEIASVLRLFQSHRFAFSRQSRFRQSATEDWLCADWQHCRAPFVWSWSRGDDGGVCA